jgi:hypothetical protein
LCDQWQEAIIGPFSRDIEATAEQLRFIALAGGFNLADQFR